MYVKSIKNSFLRFYTGIDHRHFTPKEAKMFSYPTPKTKVMGTPDLACDWCKLMILLL